MYLQRQPQSPSTTDRRQHHAQLPMLHANRQSRNAANAAKVLVSAVAETKPLFKMQRARPDGILPSPSTPPAVTFVGGLVVCGRRWGIRTAAATIWRPRCLVLSLSCHAPAATRPDAQTAQGKSRGKEQRRTEIKAGERKKLYEPLRCA